MESSPEGESQPECEPEAPRPRPRLKPRTRKPNGSHHWVETPPAAKFNLTFRYSQKVAEWTKK
jgi:hypothetical protein